MLYNFPLVRLTTFYKYYENKLLCLNFKTQKNYIIFLADFPILYKN